MKDNDEVNVYYKLNYSWWKKKEIGWEDPTHH